MSEAARRDRWALAAFGALWAAQVALAAWMPLVADEAYYLAWSRALGPGYLDHPPGIAWWVALGFGRPRIPGLVLAPLGWWLLADAARRWGVMRWRWVPAMVMATPLGLSAGLLATPDVPLVVVWCGALWGVAAGRIGVVGLCVGLGLWAKAAMLVALPGLWWALGWRRGMVAMGVAAAVYAPHVGWSVMNGGLPWSFQAGHRAWGLGPLGVLRAIGGQLLVVTPGVVAVAAVAWARVAERLEGVLRALGLPVLVMWVGLGALTRVEPNWPALAWPATVVLALAWGERTGRLRWVRRAWALAAVMTAGAAVVLVAGLGVMGPRRPAWQGATLWACLAADPAAAGLAVVAGRYQEKALLDAVWWAGEAPGRVGPPPLAGSDPVAAGVAWRRIEGRRVSEYDRRPAPRPPACDAVHLGAVSVGEGDCAGVAERAELCGLPAVICRCRAGDGEAIDSRRWGTTTR
ncbi:MAG: hypothetical protein H6705_07670 [Myxococcales bacterium]|nr:hypothetical protein [Myxococcales bacterium]